MCAGLERAHTLTQYICKKKKSTLFFVSFRIDFKIVLLVYKALNSLGTGFFFFFQICFYPLNPLSHALGLLTIPKDRTKTHGEASFSNHSQRL